MQYDGVLYSVLKSPRKTIWNVLNQTPSAYYCSSFFLLKALNFLLKGEQRRPACAYLHLYIFVCLIFKSENLPRYVMQLDSKLWLQLDHDRASS